MDLARRNDLLIERRKLMSEQRSIAGQINSFFPRPAHQPVPLSLRDLSARASANAELIASIDAELEGAA